MTSTPVPPDIAGKLADARHVWRSGDPAAALPLYHQLVAGPGAPSDAVLELGQVQLATDDPAGAKATWQHLAATADPALRARVQYLDASADLALGNLAAVTTLDVASAPDGLSDFVAYLRASALAKAGNAGAARAELERPEIRGSTNRNLLERAGQLAEKVGDEPLAGELYARGATFFGWTADRSRLAREAAQADEKAGLTGPAIAEDRLTIDSFGWTAAAKQAGADLARLGGLDRYHQGVLALAGGRYAEALAALSQASLGGPDAASAAWLLTEAADASAWQSAVAANTAAAYRAFALSHPTSRYAAEARFRAGLLPYEAGDPGQALSVWQAASAATPPEPAPPPGTSTVSPLNPNPVPADVQAGEVAARLLLWQGKALNALGRDGEARAVWQKAAATRPAGYYALRARDLLDGTSSWPTSAPTPTSSAADDEKQAETWLASWADPASNADLAADPRIRRGLGLIALGDLTDAAAELDDLIARSNDAHLLDQLARVLARDELWSSSSRAAIRLVTISPARTVPDAPRAIQRLAYPPAYADLIRVAARQRGIDPPLLQALMFQESHDDPNALSISGARGLTQVMPATGKGIATSLGRPGFTADDLNRPPVAIQFGAYFLANQLKAFGGDRFRAVAAYNSGAGPISRWATPDPDLFVERIGFAETQEYVRKIYVHEAVYREFGTPPLEQKVTA